MFTSSLKLKTQTTVACSFRFPSVFGCRIHLFICSFKRDVNLIKHPKISSIILQKVTSTLTRGGCEALRPVWNIRTWRVIPGKLCRSHTLFVFPAISAPELPNLKHLPLLHMNLFSELSDPAPSFDTQQQAHPAYDWESDRCANVFVSHPSAAHHPVAAEWRLPPSMSVSETQGIFKNHSQPFILCCWNNNVRPRFPPAQTSERICVLHLHDLPHFSIWDRRLHHLTSWKQLKGFITWLARRRHQSTAVTGGCNMKWVFYSSGGMCS